jgi:NADPH:quinone reductase-like Zn-dependent oxidoreductase
VLRIEDVETEQPGGARYAYASGRLASTNRITLRSGRSPARPSLPTKIGWEAAGEIEALGANVTGFSIGDRVALVPAYAERRRQRHD